MSPSYRVNSPLIYKDRVYNNGEVTSLEGVPPHLVAGFIRLAIVTKIKESPDERIDNPGRNETPGRPRPKKYRSPSEVSLDSIKGSPPQSGGGSPDEEGSV